MKYCELEHNLEEPVYPPKRGMGEKYRLAKRM